MRSTFEPGFNLLYTLSFIKGKGRSSLSHHKNLSFIIILYNGPYFSYFLNNCAIVGGYIVMLRFEIEVFGFIVLLIFCFLALQVKFPAIVKYVINYERNNVPLRDFKSTIQHWKNYRKIVFEGDKCNNVKRDLCLCIIVSITRFYKNTSTNTFSSYLFQSFTGWLFLEKIAHGIFSVLFQITFSSESTIWKFLLDSKLTSASVIID